MMMMMSIMIFESNLIIITNDNIMMIILLYIGHYEIEESEEIKVKHYSIYVTELLLSLSFTLFLFFAL